MVGGSVKVTGLFLGLLHVRNTEKAVVLESQPDGTTVVSPELWFQDHSIIYTHLPVFGETILLTN